MPVQHQHMQARKNFDHQNFFHPMKFHLNGLFFYNWLIKVYCANVCLCAKGSYKIYALNWCHISQEWFFRKDLDPLYQVLKTDLSKGVIDCRCKSMICACIANSLLPKLGLQVTETLNNQVKEILKFMVPTKNPHFPKCQ